MASPDKVDQIIQKFTADMRAALREQVVAEVAASVQAALKGDGAPVRGKRGAGARPARAAAPGGKRTPEQIAKLGLQIISYIDKNPDQRSEQLAEGLKLTTGELALPLKRLVAEKKLKAKGKARGTTYTVAK